MLSLLGFSLLLFGFLILSWRRPRLAFLLLPFGFVSCLWKVTVLNIPVTFLEACIDVLFLVWLLKHLFSRERRRELLVFLQEQQNTKSPVALWGAFLLLATLSIFIVPQQIVFQTGIPAFPTETFETFKIALGIWKGWMVPSFLFVTLSVFYLKSRTEKDTLLFSYLLGAFLVAAISLLWKYVLGWSDTIDDRLGGIFVSANYLVFFIAPALVYGLIRLWESWKEKGKGLWQDKQMRLLCFMLPVILLAFLLARSYASWLALLLCMALYLLATLNRKQKIAALLIILLGFAALVASQVGSKKFTTFFETHHQSSTSARLEVYTVALNLLERNWITGIGMGQFEAQYKVHAFEILGKTPYEWVMLHPHNLYLSIWLSVGILGFLLFLLMISDVVASFWSTGKWAFFLPFLYILLHGLVDTPFWKMDAIMIFVLWYVVNVLKSPKK